MSTPNIHDWLGAPSGSHLVISVSGTTKTKLVTATVNTRINGIPGPTVPDKDVQPGPLRIPMPTSEVYAADVIIVFGTDATATIKAFVELPDGTHFANDDHDASFDRLKGDNTTIALTAITLP
jgi:hypothetical protein